MKPFVAHVITGLDRGGAETALFRLLSGNAATQRSCVISLLGPGVYTKRIRDLGVEVICLDMRRGRASPLAFIRLVRMLSRLKPAIVQTWMYHADLMGGLAARISGIPVCWGVRHTNLSPDANKRQTLAVAKVCAWLSRVVPACIVSCSHQSVIAHRAIGYARKFVVIPNGLDLSTFFPDDEVKERIQRDLGIPRGVSVIGHVGRFHAQKDYPTLLAAWAKLQDSKSNIRLVMCGEGIDLGNSPLSDLVARAGASNTVIALGERNDVPELMRAMDILVISSIGEAFPNVVVEAMASGVPCVVTDVGDAAEIVGDTGWVVRPQDPDALADAMLAALEEPTDVHTSRRNAARKRIELNYDLTRMVAGYEKVWTNVVEHGERTCAV